VIRDRSDRIGSIIAVYLISSHCKRLPYASTRSHRGKKLPKASPTPRPSNTMAKIKSSVALSFWSSPLHREYRVMEDGSRYVRNLDSDEQWILFLHDWQPNRKPHSTQRPKLRRGFLLSSALTTSPLMDRSPSITMCRYRTHHFPPIAQGHSGHTSTAIDAPRNTNDKLIQ
jgi:hypothetical protein